MGDRQQPRHQAASLGLVAVDAAPAAHEDALRDLLGGAVILQDAQRHAVDQSSVSIV
jgi:hypothetical protein